ncbi:MAG: pyridoxine 5'-phosphate synthase [Verrucomicrobiales bacterium]|jgi:pyridoxine 5-phosphate synthase|nr:pyridoxine 5'-phosphate synthase [bacterium]MDF2375331.1 pyridoxine 5'-phosphate synthase [Verrucomicrobiales bacterium]
MSEVLGSALKLGVNIDHVATLRQARYALLPDAHNAEPCLIAAAHESEAAGADSITVHLRQDRRHIQDRDVFELKEKIHTKLNLEMGNTAEILEIALKVKPDFVCLVPENRQEITTEGGLDVLKNAAALKATIATLQESGSKVSLFVDPAPETVEASAAIGADMIELHTGAFANVSPEGGQEEWEKLYESCRLAHAAGLQVNAGHGITLMNLPKLMQLPHLAELNVGHHLVARGVFIGLGRAVREMKTLMASYPQLSAGLDVMT